MRLRTMQAGPVMQFPVFLVLFFAPVYVPLVAAAGLDPRRRDGQPADARARGRPRLLSGTPTEVGLAFAIALALGVVFSSGPSRAAERRARRRRRREPAARGVVATGFPMCSPRATRPGTGRRGSHRPVPATLVRPPGIPIGRPAHLSKSQNGLSGSENRRRGLDAARAPPYHPSAQ